MIRHTAFLTKKTYTSEEVKEILEDVARLHNISIHVEVSDE